MDGRGFGQRLLQARLTYSARLGRMVTQTEVGEKLGITGTSVGRYEKEEKEPTLETFARLAKLYGVSPCFLCFGVVVPAEAAPGRATPLPAVEANPAASSERAGRARRGRR